MKQSVITISELKAHTGQVVNEVYDSGNPVVLTKNGIPNAVIVDVKTFKEFSAKKKVIQLIEKAENDIKNGNVREFDAFLNDFKRDKKISN